jgi:hypothetical protein
MKRNLLGEDDRVENQIQIQIPDDQGKQNESGPKETVFNVKNVI